MKFSIHLSTRINDKRNELPLINYMTVLALEADASGFNATDLVAFGRDLDRRSDLFEQGIRTALDIWGFDGKGGPLAFEVGRDRGRIEAAVNPSSYRKPHPILARGTLNDAGVADAAARGWSMLTAAKTPEEVSRQMALYSTALLKAGHSAETIELAGHGRE